MSQKGLASVLIVILLAVALVGGYLVYQNQIKSTLLPKHTTQPTSTPEKTTETFYRKYLECLDYHFKYPTGKSPQEDCSFSKYEELNKELVQKLEPVKNYDPILCAQNTPKSIKVDQADIKGNIATLIVHTYYESSGDNPIKLTLVLNGNNWKISNIICSV